MKNSKIVLLLFIAFQLISCYSDKGNYDYHDVNEVSVSGLPTEEIVVFQYNGEIKINPTILSTMAEDESKYEYRWVAIPRANASPTEESEYVLGTGKNLDYFVTIPQNDYFLYYYILDQSTGVEWAYPVNLKVTSLTREGWMILQDQDGKTRLDMLSTIKEEWIQLSNILGESKMPYNKPKQIRIVSDMFIDFNNPGVMLITGEGTTNLDSNTLGWDESMDLKYFFGESVTTLNINDMFFSNYEGKQFCLTEQYLYSRSVQTSGAVYGVAMNRINGEGEYLKLAPFIGTSASEYAYAPPVILFDKINKRFVQIQGSNLKVCGAKEDVFSNNTEKEMVMMLNVKHNTARSYSLLRDSDNKIWLYGFDIASTLAQAKDYYYKIESPEIENATMFAIHPYALHLFYVAKNRLFQFDMVAKVSKEVPLNMSGEEISMIKFNILTSGSYNKPQSYKDIEYQLIVGSVKNGESSDKNGAVRFFNVTGKFNDNIVLFKGYKGFAKPIDVTYRERL